MLTDDPHPPEPLEQGEPVPEPETPPEEWEEDHDPDAEDRPRPNPDEYADATDEVLERRSAQG